MRGANSRPALEPNGPRTQREARRWLPGGHDRGAGGRSRFVVRTFCRALGTQGLSTATTLDALWAANPQTESVAGLGEGAQAVLELSCIGPSDFCVSASLGGEFADGLPSDPAAATDVLESRLAPRYPRSAGIQVDQVRPDRTGAREVMVSWLEPSGKKRPIGDVAPGLTSHPDGGAYLQPALNAAGDVLWS
jgi:hypothetical protein